MGARLRIFLTPEKDRTLFELRTATTVAQRIKDRAEGEHPTLADISVLAECKGRLNPPAPIMTPEKQERLPCLLARTGCPAV